MSSFFSRKSGKSSARMPPPPLTRAQSAEPSAMRAFAVDPPLHKTASEPHAGGRIAAATATSASSSSSRGREKRKPIVVHYAQSPARNVANELAALALTASNTSASRRTATYSTDMDDDSMDEGAPSFDVDSAMAGFVSSFSPSSARGSKRRGTVSSRRTAALFAATAPPALPVPAAATTRPRSSTRARLTMNLTSSSQRHAQRAEVQAKKYDVAWRNDEDCACCQVCYAMFTKLSRRRHHCRVCGDLVCGDCSLDQVLLHGRFDAPKRACVACVTLLQVMRHSGDARVTIESSSSSKAPAATGAAGRSHHSMAPLATPRYHDRLGEVHRVMAAGKKSERRGSTQTEMYVIASAWLRTWLAFTRSANDYGSTLADSATDPFNSSGYSTATSTHSPHPSDAHAAPPGPIDNMALLELSKGKLVKRPELVRDDGSRRYGETESDGLEHDPESDGDYQLISTEVWEVLVRLYGGGPAIRVVSDDGFCDWIVDVSALLAAAASTVAIPSTVEHVLVTRHEAAVVTRASYLSVEKAALISSGGYDSTHVLAQSARASTRTGASTKDSSDKAVAANGPSDRGSFTARTSHSQARVRPNSPQYSASKGSGEPHARASSKFAASGGAGPSDAHSSDSAEHDDLRSTTTGPKAATAASAFAVAMKQARLNAQKAIDDRSRGVRHADAA